MSDEEEFFVTLPSTASATLFPRNSTSNYRTKLAQRLDLSNGEWRVTLASIDLPNKFHNITAGEVVITWESGDGQDVTQSVNIIGGWYQYPSTIATEINKVLARTDIASGDGSVQLSNKVNVSYNSLSGRADIVIAADVKSVTLSSDIQNTLGLKSSYASGSHTGTSPADPSFGMAQLYVYCNAVYAWRIGDTMSPLLRTVPVHAKYGDVSHSFPRDQFVPAVSSKLDVIEIDIRWDSGEPVAFEGGKVVTTLRFKRVY